MTRHRLLAGARVLFLAAAAYFAWWSLRGRWGEVGEALGATSWWGFLVALAVTAAGLWATVLVWVRVLGGFGHRLRLREAAAVFFVGQLGKYVPGSVWSIGVQADLARRHHVPVRTTVSTSLVFLGYHVVTAVMLTAVVAMLGEFDLGVAAWVSAIVGVAAVVAASPLVVNRLGSIVAGGAHHLRLGFSDAAAVVALMAVAWACYAAALTLVLPNPDVGLWWSIAGAFASAYAVGVVIVLAPAGLGAREATFVVLLTPALGVATATGLALTSRVLHTIADFGWAAASHVMAVRSRR